MARIAARRVVAGVEHPATLGNRANEQLIGETMSADLATVEADLAVAKSVACTCPKPTIACPV